MNSVFTMFGSIKVDGIDSYQDALRELHASLGKATKATTAQEEAAKKAGNTTASSARHYEKFREAAERIRERLDRATRAFTSNSSTAKQFQSAINAAERATQGLNSRLKDNAARLADSANKGLGFFQKLGLAVGAANLASAAISRVTSAVQSGASAVFDYSSKLEQSRISFATLMGGAEAANKHIKELQDLTTSTPLEFTSLAKMSQRLQGAGIAAKNIIPLLRDIGNVAAATGDLSAERMEGLGTALSQIQSKSRVSAEEMEQLAERGVPAWNILSAAIGKSVGETRKMAEEGKISSGVLFAAFQKFSQANFGDAMERQSHTFSGAMGKITNIVLVASETMFKPVYEKISQFADTVSKSLSDQKDDVKNAGMSFGFALGEGVGAGVRNSGIGERSFWTDLLLGNGMVNLPSLTSFGAKMGAGIVKGFNGFNDKGVNASGSSVELDKTNFTLKQIGNSVKKIGDDVKAAPSLAEQMALDKAAKQAEKLRDITQDLTSQIAFFGQETQVAATKQKLINEGIYEFNASVAKTAISLASQIDGLNAAKKAADEYQTKLSSARDHIKSVFESADFQIRFPKQTELDKFNYWIQNSASNFRELEGQIAATVKRLHQLQFAKEIEIRATGIKGLEGFADNLLKSARVATGDFSELFQNAIREGLSGFELPSEELNKIAKWAEEAIGAWNTALAEGAANNKITNVTPILESFQKQLSQFKYPEGAQVFADNIPTFEQFLSISKSISTQIDTAQLQKFDEVLGSVGRTFKTLNGEIIGQRSTIEQIQQVLADPKMTEAIKARAASIGLTAEKLKEMILAAATPAGKASIAVAQQIAAGYQQIADMKEQIEQSGQFASLDIEKANLEQIIALRQAETQKIIEGNQSIAERLQMMTAQTQSISTHLKETFTGAIEGISDVFGNAVRNWDGTLGGFFKSVAAGFADMAKQIIADMIRMLIYQALLKVFSLAAGAAGGGGGVTTTGTENMVNHIPRSVFAEGGLVRGAGTSTSDSIFARLSNKEFVQPFAAVKKYGVGFMESVRNLSYPASGMPAFAGGGYVGAAPPSIGGFGSASSMSNSNNNSNVFHIRIDGGGGNPQRIAQSTKQALREVTGQMEKERYRKK